MIIPQDTSIFQKYIVVVFNEREYSIPARIIARMAAKYYVNQLEDKSDWRRIYKEEFKFYYEYNIELMKYASCCIHWDDIKDYANLFSIRSHPLDHEFLWPDAPKYIVNQDELPRE